MAETIRDVVVKIGIEQKTPKPLTPPSVDPVKQVIRKTEEEIEKAKAKFEELSKSSLKFSQSLVQAGEGAFLLARGLALATSGSEQDFQKLIRTISSIQGAFDIFKGGIQTLRSLNQAAVSLGGALTFVAEEGEEVGKELHDTASAIHVLHGIHKAAVEATTSSKLLAAALKLVQLATGPVGIALVAIGAVATAFYNIWSQRAEEAKREAEELAEAFTQLHLRILRSQTTLDHIEFPDDPLIQFKSLNEQAKLAGDQVAHLQMVIGNLQQFQRDTPTDDPHGIGLERQIRLGEQIKELEGHLKTASTNRLRIEQQLGQEKERQAKADADSLKAAQEKEDLARKETESVQERLGALSQSELRNVQRIAEKVKSGKDITRREEEAISSAGIGEEFVKSRQRARGAAAGVDLSVFEVPDVAAKERADQESRAKEKVHQMAERQNAAFNAMVGFMGAMLDSTEKGRKEMEKQAAAAAARQSGGF